MTSSTVTSTTQQVKITMELVFTEKQLQRIIDTLNASELLVPGSTTELIDTVRTRKNPAPAGLFSPVYAVIYDIIKDSKTVNEDTQYWFKKAVGINNNDRSQSATRFIRDTTKYGLQFNGKLKGFSDAQINDGLQLTSNLIGEKVVTEILKQGGIPIFTQLLSNDISAAIGTGTGMDPQFQQDIGGWAGSFYFWDTQLNYSYQLKNRDKKIPTISVGYAIQNGIPDGATDNLVSPVPSLNEFIVANGHAVRDNAALTVGNINAGTVLMKNTIPGTKFFTLGVDLFQKGMEQIQESMAQLGKATAPPKIKARIATEAFLSWVPFNSIGHMADDSKQVASISSSDSGVTTTYKDGDTVTENIGGSSSSVGMQAYAPPPGAGGSGDSTTWSTFFGESGTAKVANGKYTVDVSNEFGDGSKYHIDLAGGYATGKVTYANGAYATTLDDGLGNVTIDYYVPGGRLVSASWIHSDGTSGTWNVAGDGTTTPDSSFNYALIANSRTIQNPDGSFVIDAYDAKSREIKTKYSATGEQISQTTSAAIGISYSWDNNTTQTLSGPHGGTLTAYYDSENHATHDTWTAPDGTSGSHEHFRSQETTGTTKNKDGSQDKFSVYELYGSGSYASAEEIFSAQHAHLLGYQALTGNHLNADGSLANDKWSLSTGSNGQDTFNSDGSGSGNMLHSDNSKSNLSFGNDGSITVDNLDAQGDVSSEDVWKADGSHSIAMYHQGQVYEKYTYQKNGTVLIDNYSSDGSVEGESRLKAGAVINPDDTSFWEVTDADGNSSVYYADSFNEVSIFKLGAGGKVVGTDHVTTFQVPSQFTAANGQQSPYNDHTSVVTDPASGKVTTTYLDDNGKTTGIDWTAPDGSHGSEILNQDGSRSGDSYKADGSYDDYSDDGKNNTDDFTYNASGAETGETWASADGSKGAETINADGSSTTDYFHADGGKEEKIYKAADDQSDVIYDAAGMIVSDQITRPDGSSQHDSNNADGSSFGDATNADGTSLTYTIDTSGAKETQYFDAKGTLTKDTWSKKDGSSGTDAFNSDGSQTGSAALADGSNSKYSKDSAGNGTVTYYAKDGSVTGGGWMKSDGTAGSSQNFASGGSIKSSTSADHTSDVITTDNAGNVITTHYDANGKKVSDTWSAVNGNSGTDTFNSDGSSSGTTANKDGTSSSYMKDAAGNVTLKKLDTKGVLIEIDKIDASGVVTVMNVTAGIGTSTITNPDLTQTNTTDDQHGNVIAKTYSAGGTLLSDVWRKADGTSGKDQINPDGSTVSTFVKADKTFTVSTDDGKGNTLTQQFSAQQQLLSDQWTRSIGTHGSDTYNADNSTQKTVYNMDGSYSQTNVDAAGNQTVNYYSASGTLVRTSSVATDGSTTSHVIGLAKFNAANQLKDGSYSTTSVVNGQSVITFYDANHKVISTTAYSIPTQAQINVGLGGGYGGPLTGNYSIDLNSYFSGGAVGHAHAGLYNDTNTGNVVLGTDNLTLTNTVVGTASFPSSRNGIPSGTSGLGAQTPPSLGAVVSTKIVANGTPLTSWNGGSGSDTVIKFQLVPIVSSPAGSSSSQGMTDLSGISSNSSSYANNTVVLGLNSTGGTTAYQLTPVSFTTTGGSGGGGSVPVNSSAVTYSTVTTYANGTETKTYKNNVLVQDNVVYPDGRNTINSYDANGTLVKSSSSFSGNVTVAHSKNSVTYYAGGNLFASEANQSGIGHEYSLIGANGQSIAKQDNNLNVISYGGDGQYLDPVANPDNYTYSYVTNDGKGDFTQYKYVFNHLTVTTTNADGSVVLGKYDLVTNAGTQTTTWPDGTYSVATNDGKGNYDIINYNSDGTKFSHSWGDATGEKGSEIASSNQTYNDNGIATTLTGVQADNTFIIGNVGSIVVQPAGTKSVVKTSVNYTVPANIKQLVGTGTSDLVLTGGNDDGATITANDANDTLFAGKGVVTMVGGKGNDTFVVNNVADVVQAQGAGNTNTIKTSVSYTAAANVQTLTGTGVADITLTGNGLDNLIQANDGNDTLVAGSGNVTMVAGNGSDTMQGGSGNDTYQLNDHAATLTLGSGQSQVNGGNGNNVVTGNAAGSTTLTLGDGANQVDLSANNSNNTLTLGQGANAIQVGNGNNSVTVGSGNNTITTGTGTNEIYLGTGKNVINNVSGTNHLHFSPDVNGGNLSFTSNGSDIVISEGNTGGTVTLTGANNNPGYPAVPMKFGDGNYVTQLSNGNYQFAAGNGTVQVTGDNGNDNVTLGDGNDFVTLGDGQNTVTLGNGASQIKVGKGNDQITVQNGNNYVTAGNGNDVVTAGSGYNHISVGDGKNTLTTQDTAGVMNIITVGAGSNQITVGAGNNNITAGNGANTLKGGNGTNIVQLGSGANSVNFGDGNNQVTSNDATGITTQIQLGNGANQVTLGNGSDKVTLGDGNNNIKGGTAGGQGNDQITLGAGANIVVLGNGNDSVTTHDKQGTTNHITLGNGKDQITVGDGNNLLTVGSGANTVSMGKGNNQLTMTDVKGVASTITFGDGMNQINFGQGNNQITGGNGNNFLKGGDGANQIKLGSGQTQLTVGNGNNTISTSENAGTQDFFHVGNGNNTINVGQGSDQITVGNGSNTITGGDGQTTINLGSGGNSVTLGNGNDTITGNDASGTVSSITLGNGSNQIRLGSGNDSVKVGNGNNTLTIGAGNNQITLGNGFDTLNLNGGSDQLNLAAGQYTLNSNSAKSAIKLTGTTAAQIRLQNQGGNLIITSTASNLRLTVSNWAGGAAIGSLTSSDGHQWSNADIAKLLQAGQPGAQVPVAMGAGITPSNGLLAPVPKATVSVDTSLHQLISAMGSFAPATAAQTSLADTQPSASLRPVVFAAH